jgi:hypothetical protein
MEPGFRRRLGLGRFHISIIMGALVNSWLP